MLKFCEPIFPKWEEVRNLIHIHGGEKLSNFGPVYELFGQELKRYLKVEEDLIITNSCHTALMATVAELGCQSLVCPDYTFPSTYQAAKLQGCNIIISDVDPQTGALSVELLSNIKEPFDTVLLVGPLSSIPPYKEIVGWCRNNNKKIILDAAACFGAEIEWSLFDAVCLSFHATKSFPIGEGGAIICPTQLSGNIKSYLNFGMNDKKEIRGPGLNGKISEYACAIGLTILKGIDWYLHWRKENARFIFHEVPKLRTLVSSIETIYQTLPVYFDSPEKQIEAKALFDQVGIPTIQYYHPLIGKTISKELYIRNLCLPVHYGVNMNHLFHMRDILNKVYG